MPELPEVTTTTLGLRDSALTLNIIDVWTDLAKKDQTYKQYEDTIKSEKFFKYFKKNVVGAKITNIERRAKNILIYLSNNKIILIHLKMTGHLLYGKYIFNKKENKWNPDKGEKIGLFDPYNRFIHFVFSLDNGRHIAFCDSRKFGKITLIDSIEITSSKHLRDLGVEPLSDSFTYEIFLEKLLSKPNSKIKTALMNQSLIVGIGNIYSDEILWESGIHPESKVGLIPKDKLKIIYNNIKILLEKGISFGGDSMSDYRNIFGEKGSFQGEHNVYRRSNTNCKKRNCKGIISRKVIDGRSAHFCSTHQKLFN